MTRETLRQRAVQAESEIDGRSKSQNPRHRSQYELKFIIAHKSFGEHRTVENIPEGTCQGVEVTPEFRLVFSDVVTEAKGPSFIGWDFKCIIELGDDGDLSLLNRTVLTDLRINANPWYRWSCPQVINMVIAKIIIEERIILKY